jgi:iron complex outermembrane receptor protein
METIGGVVNANTWGGEFSEQGTQVQGRFRAGAHSVNEASLVSGAVVVANPNHRLKLSGLTERAADAEFPGGIILPTEYERDRLDVGYGLRMGSHRVQFDYGHSETGDSGTPALPMDIEYISSDLFGLGYGFDHGGWRLDGRIWFSWIDHGMTNYHLRTPPTSGTRHRRNTTDVENLGFSLVLNRGPWRFGVDGHEEVHNSDIDNPNNPMFFATNFNEAERRLVGAFGEWRPELGGGWMLELGARFNNVRSNAGAVNATPAMMGMPPAVALRDAFNQADRSVTDNNVDLVARLRRDLSESMALFAGAARKTRAPSYQERYLWLPLQATAGLADGRTYTGNPELESEIARELEVGLDFANGRFRVDPRLFFKRVDDYIQGTTSSNGAAVAFVRMMNMMNGTSAPDPLEFNNIDAEFYGFDVDWLVSISETWSLAGVLNYVRGKGNDDNLYRVPPLNGLVELRYGKDRWGLGAEVLFAADQDKVSSINGEPESAGYAVVNLNGYWQLTAALRLSAGIDNLADRLYSDHLGGINRVAGNPDIAVGERLPGYGRNGFIRVDLMF